MQTTTTQPSSIPISNAKAISHPWLMLISRSVLFMLFQALIVLILYATRYRIRLGRIRALVDYIWHFSHIAMEKRIYI